MLWILIRLMPCAVTWLSAVLHWYEVSGSLLNAICSLYESCTGMKISTSKSEAVVLFQKRAGCNLCKGKNLHMPDEFSYCVIGYYSQIIDNLNVRLKY